jgi:hypothetical protein
MTYVTKLGNSAGFMAQSRRDPVEIPAEFTWFAAVAQLQRWRPKRTARWSNPA